MKLHSYSNLENLGSKKLIKKGTILQHKGATNLKSYFVQKGLLRSYLIDEGGKMHIFMFAPEQWIITDTKSLAFSEPAALYIDALEDSEIIEIHYSKMEDLAENTTFLASEIHKFLKRMGILQERIMMLMSASAQQRYEHFIQTYPELIHRIPLKLIASYLGITPEALSNVRRKIQQEAN